MAMHVTYTLLLASLIDQDVMFLLFACAVGPSKAGAYAQEVPIASPSVHVSPACCCNITSICLQLVYNALIAVNWHVSSH